MKKTLTKLKEVVKARNKQIEDGNTIQWRSWSGTYTVPVLAAYKKNGKLLVVLALMSLEAAYTVESKTGKLKWEGYVGQNGDKKNLVKTAEKLALDKVIPLMKNKVWSAL